MFFVLFVFLWILVGLGGQCKCDFLDRTKSIKFVYCFHVAAFFQQQFVYFSCVIG